MTASDPITGSVWIPLASALLGAVVGGAASLLASIFVDRLRLRRETRVRLYDEHIGEAAAAVARWGARSGEGGIDLEQNAALLAMAKVRRAAVIAGKADLEQVQQWEDAYHALRRLSIEIASLRATGSGVMNPEERDRLLPQVISNTEQVYKGLSDYLRWLEKRLT